MPKSWTRRELLWTLAQGTAGLALGCGSDNEIGQCAPERGWDYRTEECREFDASILSSSPRLDHDGDGISVLADCDDWDSERRPGIFDSADGIDNDCDGVIDPFGSRGRYIFSSIHFEDGNSVSSRIYTYNVATQETRLITELEPYNGLGFGLSPDRRRIVTTSFSPRRGFKITDLETLAEDHIPFETNGYSRWLDANTLVGMKVVEEPRGGLNKIFTVGLDGTETQLTDHYNGSESLGDVFDGKILGFGDYASVDSPDRFFIYDSGTQLLLPLDPGSGSERIDGISFSRTDSNVLLLIGNIPGIGFGTHRYNYVTHEGPELLVAHEAYDLGFKGTFQHPGGERLFIAVSSYTDSDGHSHDRGIVTCFLDGSGLSYVGFDDLPENFPGITGCLRHLE